MIKIKLRTHDATRYLCLTMKGHAGFAEKGQDIVCSSASILAYTVAQIAREMGEGGSLKGEPCIELAEGDATVMFRCKSDETYAKAKQTFSVAKTGFALLAQNYPQYVDVKSVG
jgi:uncharacterized protein YsxB (DUF464 family)